MSVGRGGVRQYITLLHLPTTSSLLALLFVGASAAPRLNPTYLLLFIVEGFLMAGVASNYLDELKGRPWKTTISESNLVAVSVGSYVASTAIGVYLSMLIGIWFILFVVAWGILVPAYSLELFGGRLHNPSIVGLNAALGALGSALVQDSVFSPSKLLTSVICGMIAFCGATHYEAGKAAGRDLLGNNVSLGFWRLMQVEIAVIDTIAILTIVSRLL